MIHVQVFPFNPVQVNTYVLWDSETKDCILIDPGCWNTEEEQILVSFIEKEQLKVTKIVLTHAHFDHVAGVNFVLKQWKVPLIGHKEANLLMPRVPEMAGWFNLHMEPVSPLTNYVKEGDTLPLGTSRFEIIHVPGHSPGSIVLYCEQQDFMIGGDVLFKGDIGHTEVPYGNLKILVDGIKKKLLIKPDATIVYTGHGPSTTIAYEKKYNSYVI
ncbi:MBL fold metallo-hydrolase [Aureibaculum sp. A20]|uniref:MBL fold metallo-hydrolase n=1 Tax=Aureibaculum flavum TaxID=2795986 RepID=A0ABS0WT22_9FLAO|nr:MBL fold metallo-hydrolase [Aureibaculum flavum]MBJ2175140.1 MBL fold metallo-hydrolase [Aureibaculum flavum]